MADKKDATPPKSLLPKFKTTPSQTPSKTLSTMITPGKKTLPQKTTPEEKTLPSTAEAQAEAVAKLRAERFFAKTDMVVQKSTDEAEIQSQRNAETTLADRLFPDSKFFSGAVAAAAGDTTLASYLESKKSVFPPDCTDECRKIVAEAKKKLPGLSKIEEDYLLAISVYTASSPLYANMNKGLRGLDPATLAEYGVLIWKLMQGIRALSYHWGTVYRGESGHFCQSKEGEYLVMNSFISTSEAEPSARSFARGCPSGTLYILKSQSGRAISHVSCYGEEKEVLFRPFTVFKVLKRTEEKNTDCKLLIIEAEECFPDVRGRKVVLWVDDEPINNKKVMEKAEPLGVTFVWKKTTEEALTFLRERKVLLNEPLSAFRIITDMRRVENDIEVLDAGKRFIEAVRSEFDYHQKILVYRMNPTPLNMVNVELSVDEDEAFQFASFETS